MKIQEFRKLIREEIQKVISEAKVNPNSEALSDSNLTPNGFVILGMRTHFRFKKPLIQALKTQKITNCTVKAGHLNDESFTGYMVTITLKSGDTYKLFFDKNDDGLSPADLKVIKGLQPGSGAALAAVIENNENY